MTLSDYIEFSLAINQEFLEDEKTFKVSLLESDNFVGLLRTKMSLTPDALLGSQPMQHFAPNFVQQKRKLPIGANSQVPSKHPRSLSKKNPIAKSNNQITNQGQASAQHFREFTSEGEKFYFCDLCSYKTKDRGNVKKHINNKHNQNCVKYKCSMCGHEAKIRNNLKNHYMGVHKLPENVAKSATADAQQV